MSTVVNWSGMVAGASALSNDPDPKVAALARAIVQLASEMTRQKVQGA